MMSIFKPSRPTMEKILQSRKDAELSYGFEGCVEEKTTPHGFNRDFTQCELGSGEAVWNAAVESFSQWYVMPKSMVQIVAGPIEVGTRGRRSFPRARGMGVQSMSYFEAAQRNF